MLAGESKRSRNNGTANNGRITKRPKSANNIGHPSGGGAFTNVSLPSGLAKFISRKITNKYGGNPAKNIIKTHIFIKKVIREQSKYKNKVTSKDISNSDNTVTFDFKYYHDVLLFLVVIFVDYIHDLGDLDILSKKLDMQGPRNVINIFKTWLSKIKWLDDTTRSEIKNIINDDKSTKILEMLNVIFVNAKKPDEHKAKAALIKYMKDESGKVPFVKVKTNDNFYKFYGSPTADIVFDQTSKVSGPIFYSKIPEGHRIHVGLPVISDKGLTQSTNTFNDLIKKIYNEKFNDVAERYLFNINSTFEIIFTCKGNLVTKYRYFYDKAGQPMVEFHGLKESKVLSASDLQRVGPSMAIYKTCGDLGLIIYAATKNSISSTGDTASYVSCMLFTYLNSEKRLNPHKLFRSIFEDTTDTVIVNNDIEWVTGRKYSISTNNKLNNNNNKHVLTYERRGKNVLINPSKGNSIQVRRINSQTVLSHLNIKKDIKGHMRNLGFNSNSNINKILKKGEIPIKNYLFSLHKNINKNEIQKLKESKNINKNTFQKLFLSRVGRTLRINKKVPNNRVIQILANIQNRPNAKNAILSGTSSRTIQRYINGEITKNDLVRLKNTNNPINAVVPQQPRSSRFYNARTN